MKKNSGILTFFLSIFIFGFLIFKPAFSQDASLLPNAVQQFFDSNGDPLSSGKVYFYEVGTSTFKDIYNSSAATTPYTNPITLNAGGKPPGGSGIYGIGLYRQLVKDKNGNTIWDAVTAPGGGGGSTPTGVGDGNLVGTILPWSSLVAPNQYVFAYGQELVRATYPEFFTAVTLQTNVICTSSSNTLTGISDTTQISIGSPVELDLCVPPGSTVISKTSGTVTLNNPANVSLNASARFFPYGNGNGSTTFNVPDLRGYVLAGRTNMGGTASNNLTSTYFGGSPDALGAEGGVQSHTLSIAEMPAHSHPGTTIPSNTVGTALTAPVVQRQLGSANTADAPSLVRDAVSLTIASQGGGSAHSIVQPTLTMNYIIKITPDTSTSIATGVYSIGGMTGVISCGTGILCTGNIISFNLNVLASGSNGSVQYRNLDGTFGGSPNLIFTSPNNITFGAVGTTAQFDMLGSTSGRIRQSPPAVAGTTNITWGNTSGTPAVTASLPIVLNTTTGNLTCPTCATATLNAAALTKTDDTNVILTLGGSPTTALLNATSLTLGWTGTLAAGRLNSNVVQSVTNDTNVTGSIAAQNLTLGWNGQLSLTRGGTNNTLTASNGGIVWSDATKLNILSGTATANLPLLSGSSVTPSWASVAYPTSATSGGIPYFSSSSVMASSALLAANQIMIGGGAGAAPTTFACATTTTVVHGGTPPTCGQIVNGDITTNTIANNKLNQPVAVTLKGNPTSSTADIQDFTITGLTQSISPDTAADMLLIWDSASNTFKKINPNTIASSSVAGVSSIDGATGAFTTGNGVTSTGSQIQLTSARRTLPTTQSLTASSGTYTTPANVLWIEIYMIGAGGGGGSTGTSGNAAGNNGGNTCWNTTGAACTTPVYQAGGGGGGGAGPTTGSSNGGVGGTGGTVTGSATPTNSSSGTMGGAGYPGISSVFSGRNGAGGVSSCGAALNAAGGDGAFGQSGSGGGGGGGGGACVYAIINSPAATYTFANGIAGTGATAGSGGSSGGNGNAGKILVIEHYGS